MDHMVGKGMSMTVQWHEICVFLFKTYEPIINTGSKPSKYGHLSSALSSHLLLQDLLLPCHH
jgi:hypothetical protein